MTATSTIDGRLAPSVNTIIAGCDALKDAAEDVATAGRSIVETCRKVSDVMSALGVDALSDRSSFGAVPMAMKAIVASASKYVDAKTGVSLKQWAEFVSSAQTCFDRYLDNLNQIAAAAERHEGAALDPEQLRKDKRIIEDTQLQTKLWRPMMTRLPQLSGVVEALLASKSELAPKDELSDEKQGWGSKLKGAVDKVKEHVVDEHGEILRSLLGPVSDLRHRISQLHQDVEQMSTCMFELEDLLELQATQIQITLGDIQGRQAEILGQRITVGIVIPRLRKRLTRASQQVDEYQGYLQKLEAIRPRAGLSETVYSALSCEYEAALESAAVAVRSCKAEVASWRVIGRQLLEANQTWLHEERAAVTAREMIGQLPANQARERLAGIGRELRRTEEARRLLVDA
jgi:hypothetical protein